MLSTIRLFKALPVKEKITAINSDFKNVMQRTVSSGFIVDPSVVAEYNIDTTLDLINKVYGRDSRELNQTFHKSFAKVRDASLEQLYFEQIIHYMTTYGAEEIGVFSHDSVYIPTEKLEAPELEDGVRLVIIRGLTKQEIKSELLKLLKTGVALSESTVKDVLDVVAYVGFTEADVDNVANKEVKSALYDYLGIVPSGPVEFLRYAVYRSTGKTLLIKNRTTVNAIKESTTISVTRLFDLYEERNGLAPLASIFYRYKPLFLAFRTNTKLKKTINKIRRLAVANHKPMQEDLLNNITARLSHGEKPELNKFNKALADANIFRKIRLAYALKFRTTDADSILYRVRNGKSYAENFEFSNKKGAEIIYNAVLKSIVADLEPVVDGKKVFIPAGVKYALPATEKQFTGNVPTGSYVEVPEDMVVGIHWENVKYSRIDLDLSISNNMGKIGWDASYRDNSNDIQFSGDITDAPAPNGASELFHVGSTARGSWLMNLNYYNFMDDTPVPFKIVVGSESRAIMDKNHTIDPNNLVAFSNSEIDVKQKTLGIIVADEESSRFYFAETGFQNSISSRNNEAAEQARKYLLNYYNNSIVLNDVLTMAGAEIVDEMAEDVIDLSLETIDKTTVVNMLTNNLEENEDER